MRIFIIPLTAATWRRLVLPVAFSLALLWLLLMPQPAAAQGIIYVDHDANGANSGASWTDAYSDLQSALGSASPGDELWVATGVYTPGSYVTSTFVLTDDVALYGGFAATETLRIEREWQANPTVLSGDIDGNDTTDTRSVVTDTATITGTNTYHVVTGSSVTTTAVLDGFFVTAGSANGSSPDNRGGGMYNNSSSSPMLTNVTFSGNTTTNNGGGMYNISSSPTLTNVTFISNTATNGAGGMFNINNSSPALTDVTFSGNTTTNGSGGGMYNISSSPTLTNVTFISNTATDGSGGGMANISSSPLLINVTFSGNTTTNLGGGMFNGNSSSPTLTNVTFSGNIAGTGGGMANITSSSPLIQNTILWGNFAPSGPNISNSSSPTIRFSLIEDITAADGNGNLDGSLDPLFVDATNGDLHLLPASPAIDAGDNDADLDGSGPLTATISSVSSDVAGGPRIVAVRVVTPTVDLGAYEAPNNPPLFVSSPPLTATEELTYTYVISTSDPNQPDSSGLTLSATVKPDWLTLTDNSDGSGTLSGTPANSDVGEHAVTLQVQESLGLTTTQSFTISVAYINDPPSFTSTPVTDATQDAPYGYNITTVDADVGDSRTLSATVKPDWLTLTDNTDGSGTLSGTPANADVGEHPVTLQVQDSGGLTDTQSFTVTVTNVNDAPVVSSSPPLTATEGLTYTYAISTTDPDAGDTRSLTLLVGPGWLSLTDNGDGTATLGGTPAADDIGTDDVVLQVQDAGGLIATQVFAVVVSSDAVATGGISGTVATDGAGVPDVTVTVNSDTSVAIASPGTVIVQGVTNAQGIYSFDGLTPGQYTLTFDPPDGFETPDPVDVTVVAGETKTVPGVTLSEGSTLLHLPVVVSPGQ